MATVYAFYRPVQRLGDWLDEYVDRVQAFFDEARDRKLDLERVLESLAHANRQLALANERAGALRRIAEEAQRSKSMFVANVSHEFRTPLNMIIGLVDLMVETPEIYAVALSPKMREDLEVVHRNCEHLSNMINDVLDLTRIESGRIVLHRERIDLTDLVERSMEAVVPLVEKKQLNLNYEVSDNLPEVYCDRTRIQQVILNLVSNAARFTESGGITIRVTQEEQHVVVRVADTGPGVSPEDAKRIFEPFRQGSRVLWHDKGGSGLGLSISEQFVKLHGGRMWLDSQPGKGSTFSFTLPISPPMEHLARPGHQLKSDWLWRAGAFHASRVGLSEELLRPRVVVCDETAGLGVELARVSNGVELVSVPQFEQVLQAARECPAHLLVLNTSSEEDLLSITDKAREALPGTVIVGCCVPRPVQRAIDAGAVGHLTKPVTRADLRNALKAVGNHVARVLVVDDDPDIIQLFSRLLHTCDEALQITAASGGAEALETLRRCTVDLVLLDVVMPDMNGWQVLEQMQQDERMARIPVYFVSAQDAADHPARSEYLVATTSEGLSLSQLFRCSLGISRLLTYPAEECDLGSQ
jgi:signal transduction histidine kinase/CheY-like chemotaxis protein